MAYLLLALAQVVGLLLLPFGLPGLWVQAGALAIYAWATGFATVGATPIVVVFVLALLAEVAELALGSYYARRYGGSRRAEVGALLGGIAGALVGVPLPLIGSVIGAFAGAFVGAALAELAGGIGSRGALRVGWGALVGRAVATALKAATGVAIAAIALFAALR